MPYTLEAQELIRKHGQEIDSLRCQLVEVRQQRDELVKALATADIGMRAVYVTDAGQRDVLQAAIDIVCTALAAYEEFNQEKP